MSHSRHAIILAAGKGTRMKSDLPKVLHPIAGKPMLDYVLDAIAAVKAQAYVVVGHKAKLVQQQCSRSELKFVEQKEQLGTGHAVQQVTPLLQSLPHLSTAQIMVLAGDCPLIQHSTLEDLFQYHQQQQSAATVLTAKLENPFGYGRILRNKNNDVVAIREQKDCNEIEAKVNEINSGIFVFNAHVLCTYITSLSTANSQKEYYLTDMLEILRKHNKQVSAFCIKNPNEVRGINSQEELKEVEKVVNFTAK